MSQNLLCRQPRRPISTVHIGSLLLSTQSPVLLQSMANTDTNDIAASVSQARRLFDAGASLVRFTTQGSREVGSLHLIREQLRQQGYNLPLVADVHFNPKVALQAAQTVEKVRINPGNFSSASLLAAEQQLLPLLDLCRQHNTALRIGVNHGSLAERILQTYGDTPRGMVESLMEFLRICNRHNFHNVVLSVKASSVRTMVQTVRLLVQTMQNENMHYPLHLGVTEAGEGQDGRLKSALGIGALLADGIGDTIRVSLTEQPEQELPVARLIANRFSQPLPDTVSCTLQQQTLTYCSTEQLDFNSFVVLVAADLGKPLLSHPVEQLIIRHPLFDPTQLQQLAADILQAAEIIRYKTEYVACPSCGRTLFDITDALHQVKQATAHLKHLKIAVMGCIVNGPGEMADADYGYVGAARGKVSLYHKKTCVLKNLPQDQAIKQLITLIKQNGDWTEP